ncbi:hypothetical protein [Campylobacter sp. MIT 99-7217]|uniref:hypothetical protein n=1 Tax=Campylobacter sp. MIT 99-7217 TaxID=535091 RepID=UPI001156E717|nr:hypothetical protein [Campylobacter sp. MIT 99-7217]
MNFFKTALRIDFQEASLDDEQFMQEYFNLNLSKINDRWKKLSFKTDFTEGERLLFELILKLREDIKGLEQRILSENSLLELEQKANLCGVNFENLQLLETCLKQNQIYYGRFELNRSKIALFFEALDEKTAKIIKIKNEDKQEYDAFVVQMQREMIKTLKGNDNE